MLRAPARLATELFTVSRIVTLFLPFHPLPFSLFSVSLAILPVCIALRVICCSAVTCTRFRHRQLGMHIVAPRWTHPLTPFKSPGRWLLSVYLVPRGLLWPPSRSVLCFLVVFLPRIRGFKKGGRGGAVNPGRPSCLTRAGLHIRAPAAQPYRLAGLAFHMPFPRGYLAKSRIPTLGQQQG